MTPHQMAEMAGHTEMRQALAAMQKARTQARRSQILKNALLSMVEDADPWAVAGASVALLPYLERGIEGVEL